jgi:hypothetical protein
MGNITINGVTYQGNNISVINGDVFIDGKSQTKIEKEVVIHIEGTVLNLQSDRSIVCGSIGGNATAGGSIDCNSIDGNATANGSINCDDIGGDVKAGGSVNCENVGGSVSAGGSINRS